MPHEEISRTALARDGFGIERGAVDSATIASLRDELSAAHDAVRASGISATRGGMRFLLRDFASVRALAVSEPVSRVARAMVGDGAVAVRGLFFDKTPGANWSVLWHQDRTIAVSRRVEYAGFGPWSEKDGVVHVQPPAELLNDMVAVRVHLDDCGPENGPLRVLPGTHAHGILSPGRITAFQQTGEPMLCLASAGDIVAFRSLLLHASSPATIAAHRRVVHIEFVAARRAALPGDLRWHERAE